MWILKSLLPLFVCALLGAAPAPPADKALTAPLLPGEALAVAGPDGAVLPVRGGARPGIGHGRTGHAGLDQAGRHVSGPPTICASYAPAKWDGRPAGSPRGTASWTWPRPCCWTATWPSWAGAGPRSTAGCATTGTGRPGPGWRTPSSRSWATGCRPATACRPSARPGWATGSCCAPVPKAMLTWLLDPAQDETVRHCKRLLTSFKHYNYAENAWWIKAAYAPEGAEPRSAPPGPWAATARSRRAAAAPGRVAGPTPCSRFRAILPGAQGHVTDLGVPG